MRPCWRTVSWTIFTLAVLHVSAAAADNVVEIPILSMIPANDRGAFLAMVLNWDKKPSPNPVELQWGNQRVRIMGTGLGALHAALRYAVDHTPAIPHTGTITMYHASYAPTSSDGPSAGAAMAVGFLAVFRGDRIIRGVAVTGTIEPDGRIGPVGGIPDKVRAAKREGYRLVLVPAGQIRTTRWNLNELALELNITITEVETIDYAYELMTGRRLSFNDGGTEGREDIWGSTTEPLLGSYTSDDKAISILNREECNGEDYSVSSSCVRSSGLSRNSPSVSSSSSVMSPLRSSSISSPTSRSLTRGSRIWPRSPGSGRPMCLVSSSCPDLAAFV